MFMPAVLYRRPSEIHRRRSNIATAFNIVAYTLFLYDYVLTFADEVELFWSRPRRSWAFLLFFANRYITLLGRVPPSFTANFVASKFGPYSPLSVASTKPLAPPTLTLV
ncbi:hypothetical protein BKA82DRAFT_741565 [Pisolithus tinctorius]|uniref:DUF6533 domain-containing protein n=1 Tax=Pisolithus tinctorius Marx 270 TaxID=870435 RepID=A0A0C3NJC2_PISTI|nr:hypothetical protein BKA82DRAFT_741565 [Pisolithus tinctorius]KIO01085.1 hypothetical protein M404DRAFT_741565 [Pisolithus tinctorius Marx 270]